MSTSYKAWMIVAILWVIALLNYLDRLTLTSMVDSIRIAIFEELPSLPHEQGRAGPFTGVTGGNLIVAGGASLMTDSSSDHRITELHEAIYSLQSPDGEWSEIGQLPSPLAFGVSVTFADAVICAGGRDSKQCYESVWQLKWDATSNNVAIESLPPLPTPLSDACGALLGSRLYVIGGRTTLEATAASSTFCVLDLKHPEAGWERLPSCPGPARISAGAAAVQGYFYVAGGMKLANDANSTSNHENCLQDLWRFDPSSKQWTRMADLPYPLMGMPVLTEENRGSFLLFAGKDGAPETSSSSNGFRRTVARYDAEKDQWHIIGELPASATRAFTSVANWQGRSVLPSGEIGPGICSPNVSNPMTNKNFGLLTSIFLWIYAICSPFGGYLADRLGRSIVIIISLVVWSLATWMTGHMHSLAGFATARAIMGISEAFYLPAAAALIVDYHRGSTRSLATGIHLSGLYIGAMLGGVGGILAQIFGWRACFTGFGLLGITYAIVPLCLLRDAPRHDEEDSIVSASTEPAGRLGILSGLIALFSNGYLMILVASFTVVNITVWMINGWLPAYLQEQFHLSQGAAGFNATFYFQSFAFVGVLLGGILADQWIKKSPRGRLMVPTIGFLVAAPFFFVSASTSILALAVLGLAIFGMARGFGDSNWMPILCQLTDKRYRATGLGIMNMTSCVAGGIMIYVSGVLRDHHIDLGIVFKVAAFCVVLSGILLFLIRPQPEESS